MIREPRRHTGLVGWLRGEAMVRMSGASTTCTGRQGRREGCVRQEMVGSGGAKLRRRGGLVGGIARAEVVPRAGLKKSR